MQTDICIWAIHITLNICLFAILELENAQMTHEKMRPSKEYLKALIERSLIFNFIYFHMSFGLTLFGAFLLI